MLKKEERNKKIKKNLLNNNQPKNFNHMKNLLIISLHYNLVYHQLNKSNFFAISIFSYLNERFSNLSESEKEILDQLAGKIASLNSSIFYNFAINREGLGTSSAYFIGSGTYQDS